MKRMGQFACAALFLAAQNAVFADVIPANRVATWQGTVGIPGGIPNVTTVYTTLSSSATLAQINSAIASCPSNQAVVLPTGTFTIPGQIIFNNRNGVVLRGSGTGTVLKFTSSPYFANILVEGSSASVIWNSASGTANWTGGYTQGSSNITVSATTGLSVGMMICLDQLNDNNDVNAANAWETTGTGAPGCSGARGCADCSRSCGSRSQQQFTKVTGISGTTVSIWPPVQMPNWRASQTPQIWWINGIAQKCGIENMTIDGSSSSPGSGYGANICFWNTWNCWVKDVKSVNYLGGGGESSHVQFQQSGGGEVRHNYFYGTRAASSMSYGVLLNMASSVLVEDNILEGIYAPVMFDYGASANAICYNYFTNMFDNAQTMAASAWFHAAHTCMNLLEGNYGNQFRGDYFHGSSGYNTVYRNYLTGWEPNKSDNEYPINLTVTNRYWNIAGNVLGKAGFHTKVDSLSTGSWSANAIYDIGWNNAGVSAGLANDNVTVTTLYRHGNYDVVTKGILWDASNTDHTIPASLVYSSRPAWYGGVWPPFDPANGAALTANANAFTNIPAGYRAIRGTDPQAGPVNNPPGASANATPKTGAAPLAVAFSSAGSSDPEGTALTYAWVFGDGDTATTANPSHTYTTAGSYSAKLTVSDGTNSTTSSTIAITVTIPGQNYPPVAAAAANVSGGVVPLAVTFSSAGSSDPEGSTLAYSWNFGDGTTSTSASPSHTYQVSGLFTATLTVSDGTNSVSATPIAIAVGNGASGLVAAYGFEEGTGTSVTDASGKSNVGTVSGATWAAAGRFGKALNFNGGSSMVTVTDSATLDLTTGMTLEAWVYPTTLSSSWTDIIFKSGDAYFLMGTTPTSQFPDVGGSFATANAYGTSALPLNTWSHIAGSYDGTTMRFYLNGIQVSSRAQTGAIATSTGDLSIGGDAGGQYWTGMIDEVRIYNRALTATEVSDDMLTPVLGQGDPRPTAPPAPSGLRVVVQ